MTTLNDFSVADGITYVLATYYNKILGSVWRGDFSNSLTMTTDLTLTDGDTAIQRLNCNGANRVVSLPASAAGNHPFLLINTSASAYALTVKSNDGATTFLILQMGEYEFLMPDGNGSWKILSGAVDDGWINPHETWTYASASSFTVSGDKRTRYKKGARLKYTQAGSVKYAVVVSSSYSASNTTVAIFVNTDYTIANSAISANYVSYADVPTGWPGVFNWTPTWTNLSVGNGTQSALAEFHGAVCRFSVSVIWAAAAPTTAISGAVSLLPPVTANAIEYLPIGAVGLVDAGVALYMGEAVLRGSGSIDIRVINASGTYAVWSSISSTVPFTWGADDRLTVDGEVVF